MAEKGGYFAVRLANLRVDTITDFSIYLKPTQSGPPVLYREPGRPFTEQVRSRLLDQDVEDVFIPTSDHHIYHQYLEENLATVLRDPGVPLDTKIGVFYDCAQFVVHDILNNPADEAVVERSQELVNAAADLLFEDHRAFATFLQATSLDYHVYTHSVNVFVYSMMLARRVGVGDDEVLRRVGLGALLHDVGKSRIHSDTLNSPDKLTEEQWVEMKQHPIWGWELLTEHGIEDPIVLEITRSHHEKLDGTGYPDQLRAPAIPEHVRIVTICDIFDALTTRRSYKDELQSFAALQMMRKDMISELDTGIFGQFVQLLAAQPAPRTTTSRSN